MIVSGWIRYDLIFGIWLGGDKEVTNGWRILRGCLFVAPCLEQIANVDDFELGLKPAHALRSVCLSPLASLQASPTLVIVRHRHTYRL